MTEINPRVVDISHHNYDDHGPYNFGAAARWGIWGVIAKATESIDYVDPTYEMAREGARRAGLLFGAYHFFRPGRVDQQVDHFLSIAWEGDPKRKTLLLCLDHEDEGCSVEDVKQFMKAVEERTGQCPVLYSGHLIKDQLGNREDAFLGSCRLWLAQYGDEPEVQISWEEPWLWQFTGDGVGPAPHNVPGIGEDVDINSWAGSQAQLAEEWAESLEEPDMPEMPERPELPEPDRGAPIWLEIMRAITGLTEGPGSADNPKILGMRDYIARKWPDMAEYCSYYKHDDTPWCGLCCAFCVSVADIRPPFGATDTDRWMWALSWSDPKDAQGFTMLTEPKQGCIVITEREGGGHVTMYEYIENGKYMCRGGNQSDSVNVTAIDPHTVVGLMWPGKSRPSLPDADVENQTMWLQSSLNIVMPNEPKLDVDGDVGPKTIEAVETYQEKNHLRATGEPDKETVDNILSDLITWNNRRRPG